MATVLSLVDWRALSGYVRQLRVFWSLRLLGRPSLRVGVTGSASLCGVCGMKPRSPFVTSCGHLFCFYCIAKRAGAQARNVSGCEQVDCPVCCAAIESCTWALAAL